MVAIIIIYNVDCSAYIVGPDKYIISYLQLMLANMSFEMLSKCTYNYQFLAPQISARGPLEPLYLRAGHGMQWH